MRYSDLEVKYQLIDIWKLQCFLNAEEKEFVFDKRMKIYKWIKQFDFSYLEFVNHLMDFYQINENQKEVLLEIVRIEVLDDLIKFICQSGFKEYDGVHHEKSKFWYRFLLELEKKGVDINQIKPADEMRSLLQGNISNFVFALSRISPGAIRTFTVSNNSYSKIFILILIWLGLIQIGLLFFNFYFLAKILFIPMIIFVIVLFYLQKKYPEVTYVNEYVTFQDMIDDITDFSRGS